MIQKLKKSILLLVILLCGCDREDASDIFNKRGAPIVEHVSLPAFNAITVNNGINVVLTQGNVYAATIDGWKNLMPKIHLSVDDEGVLMIEDKNSFYYVRSKNNMTTIHLTFADELNVINFSGNGYITSNDTINTNVLSVLCMNASGDVDLKLKTQWLFIGSNHANVASVTIAGLSNSVGMTNWGYNPVHLSELKTSIADIHHHGLASVYLNASESLSIVLYGVGNAYYKGNPSIMLTRRGKGNLFRY